MMRTRPYRNDRIINAIRGLYFSGGAKSFAKQFQYLFPIYDTHKGEVREVPIHMVALVTTAVHCLFYLFVYVLCSLLSYLQAVCSNLQVVHRRTQIQEFLANAYLDVYSGHINTLKLVISWPGL